MQTHRDGQACWQVQSVLAKLSLCRTRSLGGHRYQCHDCGGQTNVYNSCGDRHCPQCSGSKRYDFSQRAEAVLLEGVVYYQVVFTLPSELSQLALANRQAIADLLFKSAWSSLRQTIRSEQDYDPAAIMVLHTWNQQMDAHWHVHALVPGGGPGLGQAGWKTASPPTGSPFTEGHYLVDANNLRHRFRQRAVARLNRLRHRDQLKLEGDMAYLQDDSAWQTFTERLLSVEWVSHIEPPPSQASHPHQVVRYLTRYVTGGPISDARIVSADPQSVTFLAREGTKTGGERRQVPVTIATEEFVRLWCLHIQPDGLTKTRYFGGWSNTRREAYLEQCACQMESAEVDVDDQAIDFPPASSLSMTHPESVGNDTLTCSHCGSERCELLEVTSKPSWKTILRRESRTCPSWYAESLEADDRRFWDETIGTGFYDWYLQHREESAYASEGSPTPNLPPVQLFLPGLDPPSRAATFHHRSF